jgi:hypothetical protein
MVSVLPLKKMSRNEKLQAMEELWTDLSANYEKSSPVWHEQELHRSEQLVKSGKAKFDRWENAKQRIRRKIARRA